VIDALAEIIAELRAAPPADRPDVIARHGAALRELHARQGDDVIGRVAAWGDGPRLAVLRILATPTPPADDDAPDPTDADTPSAPEPPPTDAPPAPEPEPPPPEPAPPPPCEPEPPPPADDPPPPAPEPAPTPPPEDWPDPTDADDPRAPPPGPSVGVPPHAIDSERVVVASYVTGFSQPDLPPAAFYKPQHREIVTAVRALAAEGYDLGDGGMVAVAQWLARHGRLAHAGGAEEIGALTLEGLSNVAHHARAVADAWRRRRIAHAASVLRARAHDPTTPLDAALDECRRAIDGVADAREETSEAESSIAVTVPAVVAAWRDEGPIVRVPTGIEPLDRLSRGGIPAIGRSVIIGAPSAGKTYLAAVIARHQATAEGVAVGWLGSDEDVEDVVIRWGQMCGLDLEALERCDPVALDDLVASYAGCRVAWYRGDVTIERAAADLRQRYPDGPALLVADSLQTVACEGGASAMSPRELVEANVRALRRVSTEHRLRTLATSEANRASYRSEEAADQASDIATGAESRAIEFGAQQVLRVRTPKGHPDIARVIVAKNRRADRGEFFVRLVRPNHAAVPCDDPDGSPEVRAEARRGAKAAAVRRDAEVVAGIVRRSPGIGERDLRGAVAAAGHAWGKDRLAAAKVALQSGDLGIRLVDRGPHERQVAWYLEVTDEGDRQGDE